MTACCSLTVKPLLVILCFSCFTIGMTRDSLPIPWPWSPSAFHSFPNECCTLKQFELWTGGRPTRHFCWYLFYFTGEKTGHELHHIWYHRKNKAYSWTVVLPMWTIQKFRHDCPSCSVNETGAHGLTTHIFCFVLFLFFFFFLLVFLNIRYRTHHKLFWKGYFDLCMVARCFDI